MLEHHISISTTGRSSAPVTLSPGRPPPAPEGRPLGCRRGRRKAGPVRQAVGELDLCEVVTQLGLGAVIGFIAGSMLLKVRRLTMSS